MKLLSVDYDPFASPQLMPVDHDPFEYRDATYGGPTWSGGEYNNFRRSDNIEDRRHESALSRLQFDRLEHKVSVETEPNNLARSLGIEDASAMAEQMAAQKLLSDHAEYLRRKAAGELVFDSRFEPQITIPERGQVSLHDMVSRGRPVSFPAPSFIPVEHDPFAPTPEPGAIDPSAQDAVKIIVAPD